MKSILKINNKRKKQGYALFEFALATALLTVTYFAYMIPDAYHRNRDELSDHTANGVIAIYRDVSAVLPANTMQHNPMAITPPSQYTYIKKQLTSGFDAIPKELFPVITNQYFKSGLNQFQGKVNVSAKRQCLYIQTSVPSDQCVRYATRLLNHPEIFAAEIGLGSTRITRKDGNIVAKSSKACGNRKSGNQPVTAIFCNTI